MHAWALEHQNPPVSGSGCGDKKNDKKKLVMMIRREKETTKKYTVCFYLCFFSFCMCVCIIIYRPLLLDASSLLIYFNVVIYRPLLLDIFDV